MLDPKCVLGVLYDRLPELMRWGGALARRLRGFDVAVPGKSSGNATTDALTLADLVVQELLVNAIGDILFVPRLCSIQAEESVGNLARFAELSPWVIGIDPIDGTRHYRDRVGTGYAIVVHVREADEMLRSMVYMPERGTHGTWLVVRDNQVFMGPDEPEHRAADVVNDLEPLRRPAQTSNRVYVVGFGKRTQDVTKQLRSAGLEAIDADEIKDCTFELLARGEFAGGLAHTPNVYDFPVAAHIVRQWGGVAVSVHDGRPIHFRELWLDDRSHMLRLPDTVAFSAQASHVETMCRLARDWKP